MSAVDHLSSRDTSPLKGPAPKAAPEDTSDIDHKNEDIMPLTSPGDQPVQFISGQPINGDAKVEIGDAGGGPAFVGLGKEELMKYANDPFWVRLRWFLFILFWALWVAMLAGAIVIILMAPKCAEKKPPAETYFELNMRDKSIAELGEQAKYLADNGISSVVISNVLKEDQYGYIQDFKNVDETRGTLADFAEAIKKLKNAGMRVLLTLVPNHSSTKHEWFTDTEHKYHDFYVRKPSSEVSSLNWRTVNDPLISSWKEDAHNKSLYYLQQYSGAADLNYLNEKVVDEMTSVFSFWKEKGVDAFVIPAASYIVEDLNSTLLQGNKNQPKNMEIIKTILNKQTSDPLSIVEVDGLSVEDASKYLDMGIVPFQNRYDYKLENYYTTAAKKSFFEIEVQRNRIPVLRLSGDLGDLKKEDQEEANIIRLLAFTSNVSVIMHYDDGTRHDEKSNSSQATFEYIKKLGEISHSLVDPEGEAGFNHNYQGGNQDVMAFVRSGKYVVIANFGRANATVEFGELLSKTDSKAHVLIATPNAVELPPHAEFVRLVTLPPNSAVLLEKMD